MSLADKLGFGPKRELTALGDGMYLLKVTPPSWSHFSPSTIRLTEDQVKRYERWLTDDTLIQDAFPELSLDQREILLSGIGPGEFSEAFKDNEEDQNG